MQKLEVGDTVVYDPNSKGATGHDWLRKLAVSQLNIDNGELVVHKLAADGSREIVYFTKKPTSYYSSSHFKIIKKHDGSKIEEIKVVETVKPPYRFKPLDIVRFNKSLQVSSLSDSRIARSYADSNLTNGKEYVVASAHTWNDTKTEPICYLILKGKNVASYNYNVDQFELVEEYKSKITNLNVIRSGTSGGDYDATFNFKKLDGYNVSLKFNGWPSSNCQLTAFHPLQNIIISKLPIKDILNIFDEVRAKCQRGGTSLIMFDIKSVYKPNLLEYFEPISMQEYISTNGSHMLFGIIDTNKLAKTKEEIEIEKKKNVVEVPRPIPRSAKDVVFDPEEDLRSF